MPENVKDAVRKSTTWHRNTSADEQLKTQQWQAESNGSS